MWSTCQGWPRIYPHIPLINPQNSTGSAPPKGKSDSGPEHIHFLLLQVESKRQERVRREMKAWRSCLKIIINKIFVSRTGLKSSK